MANPNPKNKWRKGQSGNYKGRPSAKEMADKRDIAALARMHTKTALKALVDVARDQKAPHAARVSAGSTLLDRGYGRAPQTIEHKGKLEAAILDIITGLDRKVEQDQEDSSEGQTIQ